MTRRTKSGLASLVVAAAVLAGGNTAWADSVSDCSSYGECKASAVTDGGKIRTTVTTTQSDKVTGRDKATPPPSAAGPAQWTEVEEQMAPTCTGNSRESGDALCGAAVFTCPSPEIRFWVWHQYTQVVRDAAGTVTRTPGPWVQEPKTFCLGADDPGVPDYAKAISLVQTGFKDLPLPHAQLQVAPTPETLVNVPTAFYAGGAQTFTQTVTPVPGISVTVTAKPTSWVWTWGDGQSATFTTPGVPNKPVVSHTYTQAHDLQASVTVSWQGSFTIVGTGQAFDIPTPATVTSGPVTVQVREARTQLVAGSS